MSKEDKNLVSSNKEWVISYDGKSFPASVFTILNVHRDKLSEVNFQANGKEFIVQFKNQTDLYAARDTGKEIDVIVLSVSRTTKKESKIKHQKIIW